MDMMMDWILAGALAAVLMAEVVDAWALHHLAKRCLGIHPTSVDEARLVRWYAEGFDHSKAITSWLRVTCLALTLISVCVAAHTLVISGSILLALVAHWETRFSTELRRRFYRVERRFFAKSARA
ncbi:MAG: hypothetical protein ACT4QA_04000 [Panacagrimonas sp.]